MIAKKMMLSATLLGLFAMVGTGLVALTYDGTKGRIAHNQEQSLQQSLRALIPAKRYDNDMSHDLIQVHNLELLGTSDPVNVYRARKAGKPVAVVIESVAPDGYGGPIVLLVGINYDGTIAGVRVVSEQETPGLGTNIEPDRTHWIFSFDGHSLHNPQLDKWGVKKDGGIFDQFTGATITPRAVVKAVRNTLLYYQQHRDDLFVAKTPEKNTVKHEDAKHGG